ncbi:MAG: sigma-54-dependent Fis family transcriptional regulator [Nitrospirae bacterium]|nr:sigma-54-dependent Fis family transcriptional regulator [Nitrospirota bacterium]
MGVRILVADDHEEMRLVLRRILENAGYEVLEGASAAEAAGLLREQPVSLIVTDLRMENESSGIRLLEVSKSRDPKVPVILLTAFASVESTVEAVRKGAFDCIGKPFEPKEFLALVERALARRAEGSARPHRESEGAGEETVATEMVGRSKAMLDVYKLIAHAAASDLPVLIEGETGTGKELVGRAIHRHGVRVGKPFLAVNCAALPEPLLESELFGHVRGAFTGAEAMRRGLLVECGGGTLFLDEVGDLPPAVQPKLLRALEERAVRPLGSSSSMAIDVRIVSATNRPLPEFVSQRQFREDLFYRLNAITIRLPPLRERREDIPLLAEFFVRRFAREGTSPPVLESEAEAWLRAYDWPGNVRQLQHAIQWALSRRHADRLGLEDFAGLPGRFPTQTWKPLAQLEAEYIQEVLAAVGGNVTKAAEILGIDRKTLYRKTGRVTAP